MKSQLWMPGNLIPKITQPICKMHDKKSNKSRNTSFVFWE